MKIFGINVGGELPNYATLLAVAHRGSEVYVVLASWVKNNRTEYITWQSDVIGNCYWGHYFDNQELAMVDYAKRLGRCG